MQRPDGEKGHQGLKVYFNPFQFSIEQNNEFLRLGYEPMPMRVPDTAADIGSQGGSDAAS
jgi:hypothetical protein